MKKIFALLLALTMVLSFAACGGNTPAETTAPKTPETTAPATTAATTVPENTVPETTAASVSVMTHAEFVAAELDSPVVIETYVQAIESWWDGNVQIYAQSEDGGYYIYDLACTKDEAAKFVPGTKIRVSGYKAEWSGEVEIIDATYEILEGSWLVSEATDVTSLLGTDELITHQNELVSISNLTVAASKDGEGNEVAFLYKWDGSGKQGDDLYFNVTDGTNTYTFTVNAYLVGTGADSAVYKAIESLKIGDTINVMGYLYWYNGAQPHVISVTPAA